MTDVADRYRKLAAQMESRIAAVSEDQWSNESPCEGWTARDVVRHVVDTSGMMLGFIDERVPDGAPSVDDDPLGAFRAARDSMQAALDDPARADQEFDGMTGRTTFARTVDQFASADLVVHQWDLARAVGQDERLDIDEVRKLDAALRAAGDMVRTPGVFGPAIEPAPDADEQTRFLNFAGRRV
jgi:uncharacterized protein (TIGR03086 family)